MGFLTAIVKTFFPKEWRIVGVSATARLEIARGSQVGEISYRTYIVQNQFGQRKIGVEVIRASGNPPTYSHEEIIEFRYGKHLINTMLSDISNKKVNSMLQSSLIEYSESKWTEERFLKDFCNNDGTTGEIK